MCKAFSCIITRNRKVCWKLGIDSHEDIIDKFKLDRENKKRNQCAIEIVPKNNNYVEPDEWIFKFDDNCPDWWKVSHEKACWSAHKEWNTQLRKKLHINKLKNLIHPFNDIPMVKKPTKQHIKLLKQWDSVGASVMASVWDSVGASVGASVMASVWDSVGASVGASVWDSVWDSVGASVGDSVGAYIVYNFKISRNKWKYTENIKTKEYPFMPVVKLWKQGLVPSFDGKYWRLHSGKEAKVVFKISKMKLKKDAIRKYQKKEEGKRIKNENIL